MIRPTSGFTLIETLVAITVLAIALIGPFTAVQNALMGSYVARDQLVASMLAQEGMEYIRSIRDNNYLGGRDWLDGFGEVQRTHCFDEDSMPSGYCTVDPSRGDFHISGNGNAMLGYNSLNDVPALALSATNIYNQQDQGPDTRFKRTVQIEGISENEIRVTVTVSWITAGKSFSVVVVDNLHNWL